MRRDARGEPVARARTLQAYSRSWLRSRTDLKQRTLDRYGDQLDRFILPDLGGMRLDSIDADTVRGW